MTNTVPSDTTTKARTKGLAGQSDPYSRFVSMRGGAAYLGISVSNLWAIVGRGEIPVIRLGGRTLLDLHDADAFMMARKSTAA